MLWLRIFSALVGIPILLGIIYIGGVWLAGALLVLIIIGTLEFRDMLIKNNIQTLIKPVVIGEIFIIIGVLKGWQHWFTLGIGISLVIIYGIAVVKFPSFKIEDISANLLMLTYVGWSLAHILLIRNFPNGKALLFFLFTVIWSTDTGAYFAGRFFGKNKLAPKVSPNKTIEGAIGGLILSIIIAIIFNHYFELFSLSVAIFISSIISIMGQIGDLVESAFKRLAGIKDSGNIIPGHGGVLDRFDSIITSAPILFYLMLLLDKMR